MFGYVKFSKGEMKISEYETYRAVYCSLCKNMGKRYGLLSRLTLSYDFTFLALLALSLSDSCPAYKKGRCTFNPLKKCNYAKSTDLLDMPSAAAVITVYHKIEDNIRDNRFLKKLPFILIKPVFSAMRKKAAKNYPLIDEKIAEYISCQNELEKSNETSLDKAADPTAKALGFLFSLCSDDEKNRLALERMGYCIGRYIYLLDAAVDFEEDKKNGSYNVFGHNEQTKEEVAKRVEPQLYTSVNEAALAFELINFKRYKSILGNIIYLGLEDTFKGELKNEQSV
ncbi:MAG: hypothetical protein IKF53_01280 [Clostridia bacterium]|nr:hypothetical protein [Clostridia bacterium]